MTVPRFALLFGVMILLSAISSPARQDEIAKKRSQLQKLRTDIGKVEKKIQEKEKKEHATLELLDAYDHQAALISKLIKKLHEEEESLQQDITETHRSIDELSGKISFLKNHYANYIRAAYMNGRSNDLELLLSSTSINQLLLRSEYLRRFSDQRKKDIDKIDTHRNDLQQQHLQLQHQLEEQRQLIEEKTKEENKLAAQAKKRKTTLAEIRKDKNNIKREMNRKLGAAKQLEDLISKLIEDERARNQRPETESRSTAQGKIFEGRRGHLRWPVAGGKIISHFGTQENPSIHTVTQNPGIDISVGAGSTVYSIADGEVSAIWWLPSFGNLVIINHKNGYRSVYAHLSDISVSENESVSEGEAIGKSGEALSGPMLHFEIWKDREKLDPEQWLGQRGLTQR
jgi:septal ring factor EnvC (AmiA/AmiB activator)